MMWLIIENNILVYIVAAGLASQILIQRCYFFHHVGRCTALGDYELFLGCYGLLCRYLS